MAEDTKDRDRDRDRDKDKDKDKEGAKARPKRPIPVIPILIGLNLALTGFVAFKVTKMPKAVHVSVAPEEGTDEGAEDAEGEDGGALKGAPGPTVALESMTVNLNETGKARYLKASFEFELIDAETAKLLEIQKKAVRQEVFNHLSGLTVADTSGAEGKTKLQAELKKKVDALLGGGKVGRVFITEFLVQ